MKTQRNTISTLLFKLHITDIENDFINDVIYYQPKNTDDILNDIYSFVRSLYPKSTTRLTFKKL